MRLSLFLALVGLLLLGSLTARDAEAETNFVPYRLTTSRHVLVRAKINGKGPYNFVFDTGAPVLIMAKKLSESLQIESDNSGWATLDKFELEGGVVLDNTLARFDDLYQLEGMNGLGLAGVEIHGLIGYPILARFRITYDFSQSKLALVKLNNRIEEIPRQRLRGGAPGGLDALGSVMKGVGKLFGMGPPPKPLPRGFLGLSAKELDGKLVITNIVPNGPADRAGVHINDVIAAISSTDVSTLNDLQKIIKDKRPGDQIKLTLKSGDNSREVTVECGQGF